MIIGMLIVLVVSVIGITLLRSLVNSARYKEISYTEFIKMVEDGNVAEVEFDSDKLVIKPIEGYVEESVWGTPVSYTYYTGYVGDDELIQELKQLPDIKVSGHIPDSSSSIVEFLVA